MEDTVLPMLTLCVWMLSIGTNVVAQNTPTGRAQGITFTSSDRALMSLLQNSVLGNSVEFNPLNIQTQTNTVNHQPFVDTRTSWKVLTEMPAFSPLQSLSRNRRQSSPGRVFLLLNPRDRRRRVDPQSLLRSTDLANIMLITGNGNKTASTLKIANKVNATATGASNTKSLNAQQSATTGRRHSTGGATPTRRTNAQRTAATRRQTRTRPVATRRPTGTRTVATRQQTNTRRPVVTNSLVSALTRPFVRRNRLTSQGQGQARTQTGTRQSQRQAASPTSRTRQNQGQTRSLTPTRGIRGQTRPLTRGSQNQAQTGPSTRTSQTRGQTRPLIRTLSRNQLTGALARRQGTRQTGGQARRVQGSRPLTRRVGTRSGQTGVSQTRQVARQQPVTPFQRRFQAGFSFGDRLLVQPPLNVTGFDGTVSQGLRGAPARFGAPVGLGDPFGLTNSFFDTPFGVGGFPMLG